MSTSGPSILDVLPEDILLYILDFLSLEDVLKMRQISGAFKALTLSRGPWVNLLHRYVLGPGLPIPSPKAEEGNNPDDPTKLNPIDALDARGIERAIQRALALRRIWSSPSPKPTRHLTVPVLEHAEHASHARRIASLRFCGRRFLVSVSYSSAAPADRERLPLVFRAWDLRTREPRCAASLRVPFRSSFRWNAGAGRGETDTNSCPVLAIVPAAGDVETRFYGLSAEGRFYVISTDPSQAELRALHDTMVITRHGESDLRIWDMHDPQAQCILKNPNLHQPETLLTTHLHGSYLLVVWTKTLQRYDLSHPLTPASPTDPLPTLPALATWRWPWPLDSARVATLRPDLPLAPAPPTHLFLRFSSFLPWPVNVLHHYRLAGGPPRAVASIPSPVRLFSVSDAALGAWGGAVWVDSAGEDEDTGKRLAGALLGEAGEAGQAGAEGQARVVTFDKTAVAGTEPWLNVAVDDQEGRIAVASLGKFELYEYV